jgi:hypothetical protein
LSTFCFPLSTLSGALRPSRTRLTALLGVLLAGWSVPNGNVATPQQSSVDSKRIVVPLDGPAGLTMHGTRARAISYGGRRAVELTEAPVSADTQQLDEVALLDRPEFGDGTLELWVAGALAPNAAANDRAFIGVVFRSTSDGSHFENIYLRPTNGRADDQLRRNHSVQYASLPDYPWYRLRAESPGKYESYADLVPDGWIHMRIEVRGSRAALFVNDARQPCLIVTDLKMGTAKGKIGLWIGPGTRGYFSDMIVRPAGTP